MKIRRIVASCPVLLLALRLDAAAQGPSDPHLRDDPTSPLVATADPTTQPTSISIPLAVRGPEFETWSAVGPSEKGAVTAPLHASGSKLRLPTLTSGAKQGGRVGALVGSLVGAMVGRSAFEGNDMGCDKYGYCYGRVQSGEAVVAGAAVGAGLGFIGGTAIGSLLSSKVTENTPLDEVGIKVAPKGSLGVKFTASVRF